VPQFVVYRNDSSDPADKRAVARVEAATAEEACRIAGRDSTLAPGQSLSAEPAAAADAREAELDRTSRDLARETRGGEGPAPEV
jgi:hypothetical protein